MCINLSKLYYARYSNKLNQFQLLKNHLTNVSMMLYTELENHPLRNIGFIIGLLHDMGKYNEVWQEYLFNSVNNLPCSKLVHSDYGAFYINKIIVDFKKSKFLSKEELLKLDIVNDIMMNVILSHHGFLNDFFNSDGVSYLNKRLSSCISNDTLEDCFNKDLNGKDIITKYLTDFLNYDFKFDIKDIPYHSLYLHSLLVKCDRLDAELFDSDCNDASNKFNDNFKHRIIDKWEDSINLYISGFETNKINTIRENIRLKCKSEGRNFHKVKTLNLPVGSGKSLSSLSFALEHLKHDSKSKIIYVMPYLTIVDQFSKTINEIFGSDYILEHHSNASKLGNNFRYRNINSWNDLFIITTMYQFLNGMFGYNKKDLIRFSNLKGSIIIFDEIQSIPIKSISLFNSFINYLVNFLDCTVILCSATQILLDNIKGKSIIMDSSKNLINTDDLFSDSDWDRVNFYDFSDNINEVNKLSSFLSEKVELDDILFSNFLIIVNTKKLLRKIYDTLNSNVNLKGYKIYTLSNNMCKKHRLRVLSNIKSDLLADNKIICISTSIIEAGVDISFKNVVRNMIGLDSIIQSGGRCNRNNELLNKGNFYLVDMKENLSMLKTLELGRDVTKNLLYKFTNMNISSKSSDNIINNFLCEDWINQYYSIYLDKLHYFLDYPFDNDSLYNKFISGLNFSKRNKIAEFIKEGNLIYNPKLFSEIKTVKRNYNVYDFPSNNILVICDNSIYNVFKDVENGVEDLFDYNFDLKVQDYIVNIFDSELIKLKDDNKLIFFTDSEGNEIIFLDKNYYSEEVGII